MNKNIILGIMIALLCTGLVMAAGLSRRTASQVACTMEAKLCPDGSYVSRVGPSCEFAPCQSESSCSDTRDCQDSYKNCYYACIGGKCNQIQTYMALPPYPDCGTKIVEPKCIRRPACLDANPRCMIAEPAGGWCDKEIIVGGDVDDHGCKPSAGYSWCEETQKCIRAWETKCGETDQEVVVHAEKIINTVKGERIVTNVVGLQNALLHVNNTVARDRITAILERFQENHPYVYKRINAAMIWNRTIIGTEDDYTFIFFRVKAKHTIEIDENGNVVSDHGNFWAMIYGKKTE